MSKLIYRISFLNHAEVYEVYVKHIYQSDMYGFIEIEEYLFNERSQLVVDPGEERLKAEFTDVQRSYIPVNAIIRIDEVERQGVSKVSPIKEGSKGMIMPFPSRPTAPPKAES
jgi:hypothetical protein